MSPQLPSAELHRLIEDELADDDAVRQVEELIAELRARLQDARQWQPAAPVRCDYGRIPHC